MTDSEKQNQLRMMTDSHDGDDVLLFFLTLAKRKMLNRLYPFAKDTSSLEIPARYEGLQIEIAAFMLNKRGAEGEVQHNENGISRTYGTADVPAALLAELTPFCSLPE